MPETTEMQKDITELKVTTSTIQIEQRQIVKDIGCLSDALNKLSDKYDKLKTTEDKQQAIEDYQKFNKQTLSRPILVGIIVCCVSFLLGAITIYVNYRTTETMNNMLKTIQQQTQQNSNKH